MVEYALDGDETVHTCPHCERPFARAEYVTLHAGLDHPGTLSEEDRERFAAAYRSETAGIRRFRLKAIGTLIGLYFTFLFVYLVVA
ncbi:DUF7410 domain-containing protein [Halalkalicoccus subterraneus]|uniref:DUF7410 domain-containing protein n=1 Tax=Halalkalicoccus subterraneus TaxID=2675002 RepID=UPI000EFB8A65|nr:C2H2-type zinc finger protein [Halalkalicoccus subterraneus]